MRYLPNPPAAARPPRPGAQARRPGRQGSTLSEPWPDTEPHTTPDPSRPADEAGTRSSALGRSFRADLNRFETHPQGCGLLHAVAASMRHNLAVALHLWRDDGQVVTLRVYPRERWVQCNVDLSALTAQELARLQFSHAERLMPLSATMPVSAAPCGGPLGPLLWQLALQGPTQTLLPEIAGQAMYRLAPAPHLDELPLPPVMQALLARLRGAPATAAALALAARCEPVQVQRLLNALYLQSALMVTRSFPAGWSSADDTPFATHTSN